MSHPPLKTPPEAAALVRIAQSHGTPTYVYVETVIRERVRRLLAHLAGLPFRLLYAMKANAAPGVLDILRAEGLGVDVVSPGELFLALRCGFAPEDILFSANNMTDEEMHAAQRAGVLLNIGELSRLEKYGRAYPCSEVCVRLNPQIGAGHHEYVITGGARSKFGIPVEQARAVKAIVRQYDLRLVGLHQHIGSGIPNTDILWQAIQVLLDISPTFPGVRFLNVGGGLGVPYRPGEAPLDLQNFKQAIVAPLQAFLQRQANQELSFWFEPGRYLVAEAGVLLMTVNTVKEANGRRFAGTDSGMEHLIRPAMYGAYHGIYNLSNPDGPFLDYDVVGHICESADVFARARPVQEIREGDVLAVLDTGAYGFSMASTYNLRPLPAEVMIRPDGTADLLRRRLSPEELVAAF